MPTGIFKHRPLSEKTKKNISKAIIKWYKVNPHPKGMLGKHHSKKTKAKMRKLRKGFRNANWKGGKRIDKNGYILIKKPDHPFCDSSGYIREHRFVVEQQIGRYLKPKEKCHHLGAKDDNRPQNLMAFINHSTHVKFEQNGKVKPSEIVFDGHKLN